MGFSFDTLRMRLTACSILLLCLLSASAASAAHLPGHAGAKSCDPQTQLTSLRKLVRQAKAIGGPLLKRSVKPRAALSVRTVHVKRAVDSPRHAEDEAIPNDSPAAHSDAGPVVDLQPLGLFVDTFEQRPSTVSYSPRSPRGPPVRPDIVHGRWRFRQIEVSDEGRSRRPEV